MISAPNGAPRFPEASIGTVTRARYDGLADWYESVLLGEPVVPDTASRLLGSGPGRLLDVGCGTGFHTVRFVEAAWSVIGVDPSDDQLRLARRRGLEVVRALGEELPFGDGEFDAAVSLWTHTDVGDFAAVCRETARVLKAGAPFVYVGTHPCFDCGESDPVVLEFDHQGEKLFTIGQDLRDRNWPSLLDEIAKCEVVCANCHRRRTARRGRHTRAAVLNGGARDSNATALRPRAGDGS